MAIVFLSVWHWQNNQMTSVPPSCSKHDVRFKIQFLHYYAIEHWSLSTTSLDSEKDGISVDKLKVVWKEKTHRWVSSAHEYINFLSLSYSISLHVSLVGVFFCLSSLLWWKDVVFLKIWNMLAGAINAWMRKFAQVNRKEGSAQS